MNHSQISNNYDGIDVAKFIASICIFTMHCNAFADFGMFSLIFETLARWGVPFFFICSSFFLFKKMKNYNDNKTILKKYCFRIISLYIVWFIYNLPSFIFLNFIYKGGKLSDVTSSFRLLKSFIFSSTFTGSWYLSSCIFSAVLIYYLSNHFTTKQLGTSVIYVLCACNSVYSGLLPLSIHNILSFLCFPQNIFCGCFYFAIGKYISENQVLIVRKFDTKKGLVLFILFYIIYFSEVLIANKLGYLGVTDVGIITVAVGVYVFIICLQSNIQTPKSKSLRNLSTIIYCCQGNILCAKGMFKLYFFNSSIICYIFSIVLSSNILPPVNPIVVKFLKL